MRFMMLMIPKGYEKAEPGAMPDAKAVAAMMAYNESLQKAGVLLALDGLHPPSMGARVSFSGGKPKVTDGPFTEAKEVLGGYWMIQVKSKEEAIEWASRCPASDSRIAWRMHVSTSWSRLSASSSHASYRSPVTSPAFESMACCTALSARPPVGTPMLPPYSSP